MFFFFFFLLWIFVIHSIVHALFLITTWLTVLLHASLQTKRRMAKSSEQALLLCVCKQHSEYFMAPKLRGFFLLACCQIFRLQRINASLKASLSMRVYRESIYVERQREREAVSFVLSQETHIFSLRSN